MTKKALFVLLAIVSTLVGLYPLIYFVIDRRFGLLQSKSEALLADTFWNIAFYTHITLGGLALLIGWTQFIVKWRERNINRHRSIGKVYIVSVLTSAIAGIYIALYATGGIIPSLGFAFLGVVWFSTTLKAYLAIRKGEISGHQKMMIYSYAACLAAVTLRIYLPIFIGLLHDFNKAYSVASWLCWIPNLIVADYIVKKLHQKNKTTTNITIDASRA
jgi:uncharacterized membrane protein